MDYPQQHIKPYNEDGKKTEQVERMFDNIAHAYDKLNHTLSLGKEGSTLGQHFFCPGGLHFSLLCRQ